MTQTIEYDEDDVVEILRQHVEEIYGIGSGWEVTCSTRLEKAGRLATCDNRTGAWPRPDASHSVDRVVVTFAAKTRSRPVSP